MKKLLVLTLGLSLFACSTGEKVTAAQEPNQTFHLHDYSSEVMDSGLEIVYVEDHSLPSISFGLLIKDGSASDPMAKSGLADMVSQVLVKGSKNMTAAQIADELGQLGTEFGHDVTQDSMWFQVSGLSQHSEKLLKVFADVILHPTFEKTEIDRARNIILAEIKQKSDHPDQFAAEAFGAYLFGGHPYARPVTGVERDLKAINQSDLTRAYQKLFRPNNSVLTIVGDLTPELTKSLKAKFAGWSKSSIDHKAFPAPPTFRGVNIRLIDKPDLTQSQIIIGNLGIKRSDPDYLKLRVANVILGGNFSSRLMDQVRVKLGLTYGISSNFEAALDRGPFQVTTFTKNQSVGNTITESMKVLKTFYSEGVSEKEVEDAKNFLIGAFPRAIETPERLAYNLCLLRLYGITDDYLKGFVKNVSQITVADVNSAIKAHLDPDDLKIIVYSKAKDSLDQVRPLGLLEVKTFSETF